MSRLLIALIALSACVAAQQIRTVGRGCCSGETPPTLEARPSGAAVEASGTGAPPSSSGALLVSPPPSGPLAGGHGSFVFLDPMAIVGTTPIWVNDAGRWGATAALPPVLELSELVLQAVFLDQGMSTGLALSDAVQIVF